jgi:hypothetical protein
MIPADEILHGFAKSFDMNFMRDAFETSMPTLGPITSCQIERLRYRKQSRATFLYEIETATGRSWITGSLYAGRKAKRSSEEAPENKSIRYIPELGMLLEQFPQDRKLSYVSELMRGNDEALLHALVPCFGRGWKLSVTEIVPIRYRPRIAAVFRVAVSAINKEETEFRRFYVKTYTEDDVTKMFQNLSQNRDGLRYALLRPVAVIPQANAIAWPEIDGHSIADILLNSGNRGHFVKAAAALTEFHQSHQSLARVSATEVVRRDCIKHAEFISSILPALSGALDELTNSLPQAFGEPIFAPSHQDMKPEHILFHNGQAALIDIEGIALSDPALDIGNMLARISAGWWLYDASPQSCETAMEGFLDGIAAIDDHRLVAAFALGKMKTATFAISHQVNDWVRIASHELEEASKAMRTLTIPNVGAHVSEVAFVNGDFMQSHAEPRYS